MIPEKNVLLVIDPLMNYVMNNYFPITEILVSLNWNMRRTHSPPGPRGGLYKGSTLDTKRGLYKGTLQRLNIRGLYLKALYKGSTLDTRRGLYLKALYKGSTLDTKRGLYI